MKQAQEAAPQRTSETGEELVVFSPRLSGRAPLLAAGRMARCHADYGSFRDSGSRPCGFLVISQDAAYTGVLLRSLRHDPDHATRLVFVDGVVDPADQALADGVLDGESPTLQQRLQESSARARAMRGKGDDRSTPALLLEYLWLRPGKLLEPRADWQHPRRHHYPLLDALAHGDCDPQDWLQQLDRDGLIEKVSLKARQRECDFCGSAHLGFVDVCPNCRSIDIDQHAALHCFTCGLIAPEERFTQGGSRVCPKCGAQLRHIGTDYDRPLETSACGSCEHVFVEGEVIARCAICDHSMPPTELRLHKIWSWRLSSLGCLAAQGRHPAQARPLYDSQHYATREHFLQSLDWMLKVSREQKDACLGLIGLRLQNGEELAARLGTARAAQLHEAFADRLREVLGEADLAARIDEHTLCLLLPHADRKRRSQLQKDLDQLLQGAQRDDGAGPDWAIAELTVSGRALGRHDARQLTDRLLAELPSRADSAQAA